MAQNRRLPEPCPTRSESRKSSPSKIHQFAVQLAVLARQKNPLKVIGRLNEPLLKPAANQANGYVPSVAYTCGALIDGGRLILPYGLKDTVTKIVTIELETLLTALMN